MKTLCSVAQAKTTSYGRSVKAFSSSIAHFVNRTGQNLMATNGSPTPGRQATGADLIKIQPLDFKLSQTANTICLGCRCRPRAMLCYCLPQIFSIQQGTRGTSLQQQDHGMETLRFETVRRPTQSSEEARQRVIMKQKLFLSSRCIIAVV